MKFTFSLMILLVSLHTLAGSESIEKYLGCFRTVTFNGSYVAQGPDGEDQTVVTKSNSSYLFKDLDGSEIPSVSFLLYQGLDGEILNFDVAEVFLNRGKLTDVSRGSVYSFKGQLAHRNDPGMTYNLTSNVLVSELSPTRLLVRTIRSSDTHVNVENVYVIEKTFCAL